MAQDNLNELFGVEEIKSQQQQVIGLIDEFVAKVTDASKKARLSELFVTDSGSIVEATKALNQATEAINKQKKATDDLYKAAKQYAEGEAKAGEEKDRRAKQEAQGAARAAAEKERLAKQQADGEAKAAAIEKEASDARQKQLKAEADARDKLAKQQAQGAAQAEAIEKALNAERERAAKLAAQAQAQVEKESSAYYQLSQQYSKAAKEAKDLAAAELLAGTSTANFSQKTKDAITNASTLHKQLSEVDASVGQYGRNVGNYKSAWNGLGNAINQLTRELPSFTNSIQTGFLAISNNLPILKDEIDQLIAKNKELASEGKATVPVYEQLVTAFFSWNTAISLLITGLTVYGPQIIDFITGSGEAAKLTSAELEYLVEQTNNISKATSSYLHVLDEQGKLDVARAKAIGTSEEQITDIVKTNIDKQIAAKEDYIKRTEAQRQKVIQQGNDLLFNKDVTGKAAEDAVKANTDLNKKLYDDIKKAETDIKDLRTSQALITYNKIAEDRQKNEDDEKKALDKSAREWEKWAQHNQELLDRLRSSLIEYSNALKNPTDSDQQDYPTQEKKRLKTIQDAYDQAYKNIGGIEDDHKLGVIEDEKQITKEKANQLNIQLEIAHDNAQREIEIEKKKAADKKKIQEEQARAEKQIREELINFLKTVGDGIYQKQINEVDGIINKNNEQSTQKQLEINQEAISEDKKQQKIRQVQLETQLANERLDDRKRQIQLQQARFDRAASVASIIEKTAEAIMAALKIPVYGEGLAVAYGAIGAIQLATVLATPLPKYKLGEDNHPGGPFIAGDGGERELIAPPNKAPYWSAPFDTIYNEPKGTKIIPISKMGIPDDKIYYSSITGDNRMMDMSELINIFERQASKINYASDKIVEAIERKPSQNINLIGRDWGTYLSKNI